MRYFSITLLFYAFIFSSCSNKNDLKLETNQFAIHCTPSISLNDSVLSLIESYISNYPFAKSFTLTCFNSKSYGRSEFLFAPTYYWTPKEKSPLFYFEINSKRIFIRNGLEYLTYTSEKQDLENQKYWIPRGQDSVLLMTWPTPLVAKDGLTLYLKRAIYFSIGSDNQIEINHRPDTLFLPRVPKKEDYKNNDK